MTTEGPVIETARLRLRRMTVDDAHAMAALLGDDYDAIRHNSHIPFPCTVEAAHGWIALRSQAGSYPFAIEQAGAMIGSIGFRLEVSIAEMGYWLGRAHWGHGYATEAAAAVLTYAASIGARRVEADTFLDNAASQRVLDKLGFLYRDEVDEVQPLRGGVARIARYVWLAPR